MKSLYKCTTLAIGLSTSISCFASIGPGNFYVGAAGGYNEVTGTITGQTTPRLIFGGVTQTNVVLTPSPDFQDHGAMGTLLVGYNVPISPIFALALEGRANLLSNREVTHTSVNETVGAFMVSATDSLTQKNELALLIKPALNFNDSSQLYVVAGLASSTFQSTNRDLFSLIPDPSFTLSGRIDQSISKRKTGGLFGVGLQQNMVKNFNIRLEFDYLDYGRVPSIQMTNMPIVSNPPSPDIAGSTLSSTAVSYMKNARATLGVVYNFG
ncbi:MAG: outer membrane beta-barrel protein [Legionella sp.]|nr:outer membrane beta-barrel protein [Legionella sp.]